jgi:hypothetical protein
VSCDAGLACWNQTLDLGISPTADAVCPEGTSHCMVVFSVDGSMVAQCYDPYQVISTVLVVVRRYSLTLTFCVSHEQYIGKDVSCKPGDYSLKFGITNLDQDPFAYACCDNDR